MLGSDGLLGPKGVLQTCSIHEPFWPEVKMNEVDRNIKLATEVGFVCGVGKTVESLNATFVEIASTNIPVLLLGESGTGKDVYATLLHRLSGRSDSQLRKMSCSILDPGELLRQVHHGLYTELQGGPVGTLFLDGIDELEPACQRTLLSVLPESQAQRGNGNINNFPRLVSSSSQNLDELVEMGAFREGLYFRINGVCLRLPPLRERKEDIRDFFEHFLRKHAQDLKRAVPAFDQETIDQLMVYDWPGNIRQLENLARQMVALGNARSALAELRTNTPVPNSLPYMKSNSPLKLVAKAASKKAERELILRALERTHWNRKQTARDLRISYKSLLYKIKQIEASDGKYEN